MNLSIEDYNNTFLKLFSKLLNNNKTGEPKIMDKDNFTPQCFDVSESHKLISHKNLSDQEKRCLVFLQGHSRGCAACIFLINKFGKMYYLLPHLVLARGPTFRPSMHQTHFCPQLVKMSVETRKKLVGLIPEICKICLKSCKNSCQQPFDQRFMCQTSKTHYLLCVCKHCKYKTDGFKFHYNSILSTSKDKRVNSLQLETSDKKFFPAQPVLFCDEDSDDEIPRDQSEHATSNGCTTEVPSAAGNIDFNEIDDCQQEVPTIPTLLNSYDFDQLIKTGKILEPKNQALYFRIGLVSNNGKILSAIYDSGAKGSVFLTKYLQDQSYFPNKLTS